MTISLTEGELMAEKSYNHEDLNNFYDIMERLKMKIGGFHYLRDCHGRMDWPERGVYFFFENGECRLDSDELRVVRVGTHAVSRGSKTTLWNRLRTHRGGLSGKGNHRASVFRLLVGSALINQRIYPDSAVTTWGNGSSAPRHVRGHEEIIEFYVSQYIGSMPFLWVAVNDEPGSGSLRKYIEKNSIALLSNLNGCPDIPSLSWIGKSCRSTNVQASGLWNSDHVNDNFEPEFLEIFEEIVDDME